MAVHGAEETPCKLAHESGLIVIRLIINSEYALETLQINEGTRKV